MWDLSFLFPSILLLGLLLLNYFSQKKLPISINRSYIVLLHVAFIVVLSNFVASYACNHYQSVNDIVLYLLNLIFFLAFVIRAYCFFTFTSCIFHIYERDNIPNSLVLSLPLIISEIVIISTPFTKAIFYVDENGYQEGKYFQLITIVSLIYIALTISRIIHYRHRITNQRYFYGIILYTISIVVGLACRQFLQKLLLMDTFCVMAILIIDVIFMNPEYYIDRRSRLFNSDGLRKVLDEINTVKENQIITFVINNYLESRDIYGAAQMDKGLELIGIYLSKTFPDYNIFYYRSGRFAIMTKPEVDNNVVISMLSERFAEPWISNDVYIYLDITLAKVDSVYMDYDTDTVFNTLVRVFKQYSQEKLLIVANEDFIDTLDINYTKRALENAIEKNKVEIFLQPIVRATDFAVVGAESLCRIRDDEGQILSPSTFIPIAESNGRIIELGEQVFEKTCQFISQNDMDELGLKWVNVNLSTIQFMTNNLASKLDSILKKYNLDPDFIHLEITETAVNDESLLINQINQLRNKGFKFALDDYGSGYSNASRLSKMPFSNIKLDMSLVWEYCNNPNSILPMLVRTFKETSYTITAEGIETIDHAEALYNVGCNYLQGMYFSPPIPTDEFVAKYSTGKNN